MENTNGLRIHSDIANGNQRGVTVVVVIMTYPCNQTDRLQGRPRPLRSNYEFSVLPHVLQEVQGSTCRIPCSRVCLFF
jgi:hypothetical protein